MIWFRIDNRLVHGQIIETWLPYTRATRLVVCNDELAKDELRQQIMLLAVPGRIQVSFSPPGHLQQLLSGNMHYAPGKQQVCGHASFSDTDSACLRAFSDRGVTLDFRCVPNDTTEVTDW